jgi:hypothetical protein
VRTTEAGMKSTTAKGEGGKGSFQIVGGARCGPYGFRKGAGAFRVQLLLPSTVQFKNQILYNIQSDLNVTILVTIILKLSSISTQILA